MHFHRVPHIHVGGLPFLLLLFLAVVAVILILDRSEKTAKSETADQPKRLNA